ncbi:MAG: hypothetical protein ACOX6D_02250 [Thermoguttaceae bacterium]|jgi:hypothetical protein
MKKRFIFAGLCLALLGAAGCQSLNDDPNNTRVWFPSLVAPGHLNPAHEKGYPDGTDPYPNANIGTDSMQMRPHGYDMPRNWNANVVGDSTVPK